MLEGKIKNIGEQWTREYCQAAEQGPNPVTFSTCRRG